MSKKVRMPSVSQQDQSELTRRRIIEVAIRMMAVEGITGVSLRRVNTAAGCLNASAAHYHFGGKQGLIEAAIEHVLGKVNGGHERLCSELEARRAKGRSVTIREALEAVYVPFLALILQPGYGIDACRFMAHVLLEADPRTQVVVNRFLAPVGMRMVVLLGALLPELPPATLIMRIVLMSFTVAYGTSTLPQLQNSPFGDMTQEAPLEHAQRLFDFLEGALRAPTSAPTSDPLAPFRKVLEPEGN